MPDTEWIAAVAAAVFAAGGAAEVVRRWVVCPMRRMWREVREFLSDWRGEPTRPGVPGRPGVMRRLEQIERHVGNGSDRPLRQVVEGIEERVTALEQHHAE